MKNKLFILGWDNALVSDIVENKVHPAYLAMLAEVDEFACQMDVGRYRKHAG